MTEIKIGDLIKTQVWFGVVLEVMPTHDDTKYLVHWFFPDARKPVLWLDGYHALKYRINVLTAVGK